MITVAIKCKRIINNSWDESDAIVHVVRDEKTICGRKIGYKLAGWILKECVSGSQLNQNTCKTCCKVLNSEARNRMLKSLARSSHQSNR